MRFANILCTLLPISSRDQGYGGASFANDGRGLLMNNARFAIRHILDGSLPVCFLARNVVGVGI